MGNYYIVPGLLRHLQKPDTQSKILQNKTVHVMCTYAISQPSFNDYFPCKPTLTSAPQCASATCSRTEPFGYVTYHSLAKCQYPRILNYQL